MTPDSHLSVFWLPEGLMKHWNGSLRRVCYLSEGKRWAWSIVGALPKADKGQEWHASASNSPETACARTQISHATPPRSATFPRPRSVFRATLACGERTLGSITAIKNNFRALFMSSNSRSLRPIQAYLCWEWRLPWGWGGGQLGDGLFRSFCFGEPVLTMIFSSLVGDALFSHTF